jgi:hypothetical protein
MPWPCVLKVDKRDLVSVRYQNVTGVQVSVNQALGESVVKVMKEKAKWLWKFTIFNNNFLWKNPRTKYTRRAVRESLF